MKLSKAEVETSYGMYELYLYHECKCCEECFNDCEFGYQAKLINGETEV